MGIHYEKGVIVMIERAIPDKWVDILIKNVGDSLCMWNREVEVGGIVSG